MNYITRLKLEAVSRDAKIKATAEGISDLKSYLQSSKFHTDTSVNVRDVLLRLNEIESRAMAAADEAWEG